MSSVTKLLALFVLASTSATLAATTTLRVCADPNNLPFSNRAQQGFENHLAQMVAKDLGMQVSYDWFPQRSAFFRKTLNAGKCDVVMGVPSGIPIASTTSPTIARAMFSSREEPAIFTSRRWMIRVSINFASASTLQATRTATCLRSMHC